MLFKKNKEKVTVEDLKPVVEKLKEGLEEIKPNIDPLTALVQFFNFTSPIHDCKLVEKCLYYYEDKNCKKHNDLILTLQILNGLIIACGRDPFGLNRTDVDQEVTDENVWIGDRSGLFTKNASFWRRNRENVIDDRAKTFVEKNREAIIRSIDEILSY